MLKGIGTQRTSSKEARSISNFNSNMDRFNYIIESLDKEINKWCRKYKRPEIELEDLKQEAYETVWKIAIKKADNEGYILDKGGRRIEDMIAYSATIIRDRLADYNREVSNIIKDTQINNKVKGKIRKLKSEGYNTEEIADKLKMDIRKIEELESRMGYLVSLDGEKVSGESEEFSLYYKYGVIEKDYEKVEDGIDIDGNDVVNEDKYLKPILLEVLKDEKNTEIALQMYKGVKKNKIAKDLGIKPPAISQRIKKIKENLIEVNFGDIKNSLRSYELRREQEKNNKDYDNRIAKNKESVKKSSTSSEVKK